MKICTFASGSRGNCSLVSASGFNFLVDVGISMKRVKENLSFCGLKLEDVDAIFITHEHSDHISGLPMICKHFSVPVYAPEAVARHLRRTASCPEELIKVFPLGSNICFGDGINVRSIATSHDTDESAAYRFEADAVFSLATDTGCVSPQLMDGLLGSDIALIEANHDIPMLLNGDYPYHLKRRILSDRGHLSNESCAGFARRLAQSGTKYIILGHLSRENNTPTCAFSTVGAALEGCDVQLFVAPENERFSIETGGE